MHKYHMYFKQIFKVFYTIKRLLLGVISAIFSELIGFLTKQNINLQKSYIHRINPYKHFTLIVHLKAHDFNAVNIHNHY